MTAKVKPVSTDTKPKHNPRNPNGNPAWTKGISGNPLGRPKDVDRLEKLSKRDLKDREFLMILRKIRPHVADSIMTAAKIMKNDEAADTNKLKAATILLDAYRKMVLDMYDGEDQDGEGQEIQEQNKPVFSLRVIDTPHGETQEVQE